MDSFKHPFADDSSTGDPSEFIVRLRTPKDCICEGLKWLGGEFDINHPDFGKVVPCACLAAEKNNKLREFLWDGSGITQSLDNPTFSSFNPELYKDGEYAKLSVMNWVRQEVTVPWLIIMGPPGLGKTHLCKAATGNLVGMNQPVFYTTVRGVMNKSREWISNKQGDKWSRYLNKIEHIKYLVLDDLGQEYTTDWSKQILFDIIDTRYETKLPTLITTNIQKSEWEKQLGKACTDRLSDHVLSKHIVLQGSSVRQKASR